MLVEVEQATLTRLAIIQEDAILLCTGKAPYIYLPVGMPVHIELLASNTQVRLEVQHHRISRQALLRPVLDIWIVSSVTIRSIIAIWRRICGRYVRRWVRHRP